MFITDQHSTLYALVRHSLEQANRSGLTEMLKHIVRHTDAYGCILWEEVPHQPDRLYTLAHWFPRDQSYAVHNLPRSRSVTGTAMDSGWETVESVQDDPRVNPNSRFMRKFAVQSFCSIRVHFSKTNRGALNLYSESPGAFPYTREDDELKEFEEIALLIPFFTQAIHNQVSFNLLSDINVILDKAELDGKTERLSIKEMKRVFRCICDKVQATFQCLETSLFLKDPAKDQEGFELIWSTWPEDVKRPLYHADEEDGLTGWALKHRQTVQIFDLAHYKRDEAIIQKSYPGIRWQDSLLVAQTVRKHWQLPEDVELPPLSYIAVPIKVGDELLGVIRCSCTESGPYYFASRSEELLKLIASRIAHTWQNWLNRRRIELKEESWSTLVESIKKLDSFVREELAHKKLNEDAIIDRTMQMAFSSIPGAEIVDIRLYRKGHYLEYAYTYGDAWKEGTPEQIEQRKKRRYDLSGKFATSRGAKVFNEKEPTQIANIENEQPFPQATQMIIALVRKTATQKLGVIDIRTTKKNAFPENAPIIVELIAQQLGLYYHLAESIASLEKLRNTQAQTYQNLSHQLRTPIIYAIKRAEQAIKKLDSDEPLRQNLIQIRALCNKARTVTTSVSLYGALAQGQDIDFNPTRLDQGELIRLLINLASDNELMSDPETRIKFDVDRGSFKQLDSFKLRAEKDLLTQALSNILENAGKYSYEDTTVRISVGFTKSGRFCISVKNKGIPIKRHEVKLVKERDWRSDVAKSVTGEGSGIGLWIVDYIMKAHRGNLEVLPTDDEGWTTVKLIFPAT